MSSNRVPGFLPSTGGFAFTNDFPDVPAVRLWIPLLGRVGLGQAGNGMCGGMVFAARDFVEAGVPVVEDPVPPPEGSPLFDYLVRRLIAAFNLPAGVLRYWWWMLQPDGDALLRRGVRARTLRTHWPRIRQVIDAGRPCPLGVVAVRSWRPSQMRHNHVVLAYGYETDDDQVSVLVYDPNSGRDDGVRVTVPHRAADPVTSNVNIDHQVRGFFALRYRPRDPRSVLSRTG